MNTSPRYLFIVVIITMFAFTDSMEGARGTKKNKSVYEGKVLGRPVAADEVVIQSFCDRWDMECCFDGRTKNALVTGIARRSIVQTRLPKTDTAARALLSLLARGRDSMYVEYGFMSRQAFVVTQNNRVDTIAIAIEDTMEINGLKYRPEPDLIEALMMFAPASAREHRSTALELRAKEQAEAKKED